MSDDFGEDDELGELIEEHDLDSEQAEYAQELIDEGLSEDEAAEIAGND
ncbi:MAG: hypothetical protein WC449_01195 [Candidatus Paceibacterota bacterium]